MGLSRYGISIGFNGKDYELSEDNYSLIANKLGEGEAFEINWYGQHMLSIIRISDKLSMTYEEMETCVYESLYEVELC